MFLEWWNRTKSLSSIWQHFSCLLDEGRPRQGKNVLPDGLNWLGYFEVAQKAIVRIQILERLFVVFRHSKNIPWVGWKILFTIFYGSSIIQSCDSFDGTNVYPWQFIPFFASNGFAWLFSYCFNIYYGLQLHYYSGSLIGS